MYLDKGSVLRKGDFVTYWAKKFYYKPQKSILHKLTYSQQHVQHQLNCRQLTVSFTGLRFYNQAGKLIAQSPPMKKGPYPVKPGGFIIREAALLCGTKSTALSLISSFIHPYLGGSC